MRFNVIWLDDDGYAKYAEHFEYPDISRAMRMVARKFDRATTIQNGVSGFLVTYADSEFIQRYTDAPGTSLKRIFVYCETELACRELPHLIRP